MIGGCAMKFKLPYLRVNRDRKGRPRYYVRRPGGHKAMLIRAKPGTPAFHSAYEAAMGAPKVSPNAANAGTWRWLCAAYLASPEFGELSPATKAARRRILESTWSEPFTPKRPLRRLPVQGLQRQARPCPARSQARLSRCRQRACQDDPRRVLVGA
jgi:hypothetical protein